MQADRLDEALQGDDAGEFKASREIAPQQQFRAESLNEEIITQWADSFGVIVSGEIKDFRRELALESEPIFGQGGEVDEQRHSWWRRGGDGLGDLSFDQGIDGRFADVFWSDQRSASVDDRSDSFTFQFRVSGFHAEVAHVDGIL